MRARTGPLLLLLTSITSVQVGGAIAATLVPAIGAGPSVLLRLVLSAALMLAVVRPRLRGYDRRSWVLVLAFGASLAAMNFTFYSSLAYLPIGVAVTIEFLGPLLLAASQSRRAIDQVAVVAAGLGVLLVSGAIDEASGGVSVPGVLFVLTAGAMWATYIVLAQRVGAIFPKLDGLALAMAVAAVLTVPVGATALPHLDGGTWLRGLGIALMSSVIPYSIELVVLRRVDQRVFGILLSLEPAVAATAGLVILGQRLAPTQVLGMACVIAASAIVVATARPQGEHTPAETMGS